MSDSANPLWAIIPVKPLAESKQRLASVYDRAARVALAQSLFLRTLQTVLRACGIARVVVVSRDRYVLHLAQEAGAHALEEITHGLNAALEHAACDAIANGAGALLVLPIDLPWLTTADVESIIAFGAQPPCIVLAPAHRDGGTNALLINPPGLIHYAFGEQSFMKHQQQAQQSGVRLEIYRSERVAWDVDQPEDLDTLGFSSVRHIAGW